MSRAEAMATGRAESMQEWERAEIARSSVEATLTADNELRVSAGTFARYARPPADTAYPLEYAYYLLGDVAGKRSASASAAALESEPGVL